MPHRRKKYIVFDLDDTIFDYTYSNYKGFKRVKKEFEQLENVQVSEIVNVYKRIVNCGKSEGFLLKKTPKIARLQRFIKLFQIYNIDPSDSNLQHALHHYSIAFKENQRCIPGIKPLLKIISKKAGIAIITNGYQKEQASKIAFCAVSESVDFLFSSETVGFNKPDKKLFQHALDTINCLAEEVVMVGNKWEDDILGALSLGIDCVWFNRDRKEIACPKNVIQIYCFEPPNDVAQIILGL